VRKAKLKFTAPLYLPVLNNMADAIDPSVMCNDRSIICKEIKYTTSIWWSHCATWHQGKFGKKSAAASIFSSDTVKKLFMLYGLAGKMTQFPSVNRNSASAIPQNLVSFIIHFHIS